jgi:hypothetical protein
VLLAVALLSALAVVALSEAEALPDATVAVWSVSEAVGWLLQLLRNRPPATAGTTSHDKAVDWGKGIFMQGEGNVEEVWSTKPYVIVEVSGLVCCTFPIAYCIHPHQFAVMRKLLKHPRP